MREMSTPNAVFDRETFTTAVVYTCITSAIPSTLTAKILIKFCSGWNDERWFCDIELILYLFKIEMSCPTV